MSKWRKHVTQALDSLEPPGEGQQIVQALGSRGSNLVEVRLPGGTQTLCVLPAKFNKKLWVKRGGYLVIERGGGDTGHSAVTGTIVTVLYDKDVRYLRSLPGVWPEELAEEENAAKKAAAAKDDETATDKAGVKLKELSDALPAMDSSNASVAGGAGGSNTDLSSEDDDLPPLYRNRNRPVREYTYSDDDTSEEDT